MNPRLSVGLPVHNGQAYLAEALDSLLGQSFDDFELIISDNASTDATPDICRYYAASDPRVRYIRQDRNIGASANHNILVDHARGDLFKWAAHDDLYARDLLGRCVALLDEHPEAVLAHSWTARMDGPDSTVAQPLTYLPTTGVARASDRFHGMLFGYGGDDDYGVIRIDVMRRVLPYGSYFRADRTMMAALALYGPFRHVPDWLYFRRDRPDRASVIPTVRSWCVAMDPRRADRLRHPVLRLRAEYIWELAAAVRRAPLPPGDRRECYRHLAGWLGSRAVPPVLRASRIPPLESATMPPVAVATLVTGPRGARS